MKKQFDAQSRHYTLCVLTRDIPGVLSQVARLFSRKGYNIESIVTGATDRPGTARLSIELIADERKIEQIALQCFIVIVMKQDCGCTINYRIKEEIFVFFSVLLN